MSIFSFLFPSDADRLRSARASIKAGEYEAARKTLLHCKGEEAEALYEECSAAIDKADKTRVKKGLAAQGFHGWKVEVTAKGARRKAELEALANRELEKAGVDLDLPELDQAAVKVALSRVSKTLKSEATIRLVPVPGGTRGKT
jgi:hypothetical protein